MSVDIQNQITLLSLLPRRGSESEKEFNYLQEICRETTKASSVSSDAIEFERFFNEALNCYRRIINTEFRNNFPENVSESQRFLMDSDKRFGETLNEMLSANPVVTASQFQTLVQMSAYQSSKAMLTNGIENKKEWVNDPFNLTHMSAIGAGGIIMTNQQDYVLLSIKDMVESLLDNAQIKAEDKALSLARAILAYFRHGNPVVIELFLNHGASIENIDISEMELIYGFMESSSQSREKLEYLIAAINLPKPQQYQMARYPWINATYMDMGAEAQARTASTMLIERGESLANRRKL